MDMDNVSFAGRLNIDSLTISCASNCLRTKRSRRINEGGNLFGCVPHDKMFAA